MNRELDFKEGSAILPGWARSGAVIYEIADSIKK